MRPFRHSQARERPGQAPHRRLRSRECRRLPPSGSLTDRNTSQRRVQVQLFLDPLLRRIPRTLGIRECNGLPLSRSDLIVDHNFEKFSTFPHSGCVNARLEQVAFPEPKGLMTYIRIVVRQFKQTHYDYLQVTSIHAIVAAWYLTSRSQPLGTVTQREVFSSPRRDWLPCPRFLPIRGRQSLRYHGFT